MNAMNRGQWTPAGELPWDRNLFGAASAAVRLADGRVLIAGGGDERLAAQDGAALFDPRDGSWTGAAPLREPRRMHSATLLSDGRVLVVGGQGRGSGFPVRALDSAETYDPVERRWSDAGRMGQARCGHSATRLPDGRVLVAGGTAVRSPDSERSLSSTEVFDPVSGRWTPTGPMLDARSLHPAVALPDGTVLVAGGWAATRHDWRGGAGLAYCERYDPATGRWTATGGFAEARTGHRLTALADGTVLATGGGGDPDSGMRGRPDPYSRATAERYDPATGAWSREADMPCGRALHQAVRLPTGEVLVMGGTNDLLGEAGYRSAARYDPRFGTWSEGPGMAVGRVDFAAAVLADGRVLVAGGSVRTGPATPSGSYLLLTRTSELFTA
ncbi:kelch repeat-containing protein [Streptomyces sp. NPDC021012]|uniref:Kelch repeat-containing protein n=1 Tax=Streptomyces sp. NPDC021012 TaxID=3365107 RepID=UPI003791D155